MWASSSEVASGLKVSSCGVRGFVLRVPGSELWVVRSGIVGTAGSGVLPAGFGVLMLAVYIGF